MGALTGTITNPSVAGVGEKIANFVIAPVNSGDTLDLSSVQVAGATFSRLKSACWTPLGNGGGADSVAASVLATIGNGATGSNNKLTFTLTNMVAGACAVQVVGN